MEKRSDTRPSDGHPLADSSPDPDGEAAGATGVVEDVRRTAQGLCFDLTQRDGGSDLQDEVEASKLIGTVVEGRFRVVSIIGRGGMGVVYRAEHVRLHDRACALKVLGSVVDDLTERQRFDREVMFVSRLRSPHTVQILDTGELADGRPYIVMELLEGQTLDALLASQSRLELDRAIGLIRGVLMALREAHAHGIVHRDLKPANVFVVRSTPGNEEAKVLDFGIAKDLRADINDLTQTHIIVGTPKYMAPEQFQKKPADPRTDLYTVGLLLYRMLAGRLPFDPDDRDLPAELYEFAPEHRLGWLHVKRKPLPIAGVSPVLWSMIDRLLAKKPADRFADAAAALEALERVADETEHHGNGRRAKITAPMASTEPASSDPADPAPSAPITPEIAETVMLPEMPLESSPPPEPADDVVAPGVNPGQLRRRLIVGALVAGAVATAVWYFADQPIEPLAPPAGDPVTVSMGSCTHRVTSLPSGAEVWRANQMLGHTPIAVERPCEQKWIIRLELDEFLTATAELGGPSPGPLQAVRLRPAPRGRRSRAPRSPVPHPTAPEITDAAGLPPRSGPQHRPTGPRAEPSR